MPINKKEIEVKVIEALEQLRPFLQADSGDMELVENSRRRDRCCETARFM